jgi:hypothetical protein
MANIPTPLATGSKCIIDCRQLTFPMGTTALGFVWFNCAQWMLQKSCKFFFVEIAMNPIPYLYLL